MKPVRQLLITFCISFIIFLSASGYCKAVIVVKNGDTVDLGRFPGNLSKKMEFVLTNTGDSDLQISKITTNCICLVCKLNTYTISPGNSVVLKVFLRRGSVSGVFKKLINVSSNTGQPLVLSVKGVAEPLIITTPEPREYVGHPLPETGYSREFLLTADRDGVVIDSPVVYGSGSEYCKAVLTPVDARQWKLAVKMEQGKVGKVINTTVRLAIKNPKGWSPLVFSFKGRWGYELRTNPSRMPVPVDFQKAIVREFELTILGSKQLDMKKLVLPSGPGVKISCQRLAEDRVKVKVELDPTKINFQSEVPFKLKFEYPQSVYGIAVFIPR